MALHFFDNNTSIGKANGDSVPEVAVGLNLAVPLAEDLAEIELDVGGVRDVDNISLGLLKTIRKGRKFGAIHGLPRSRNCSPAVPAQNGRGTVSESRGGSRKSELHPSPGRTANPGITGVLSARTVPSTVDG